MSGKIAVFKNIDVFFHGLIEEASNKHRIVVGEDLKYYLVSLLSSNMGKSEQEYCESPLAILIHEANFAPLNKKIEMLKFIGDESLYMAGYFSESLKRKLVDRSYYINIGGMAFRTLAGVSVIKSSKELYKDIYKDFSKLVELLTAVSIQTFSSNYEDIVRLYESWQISKSQVIENKLKEKGVITDAEKKKS